MARITVEDCIDNVDSRFELIMLASRRARDLASGAVPTLPRDKDKNPVVALREIAEETINLDVLRENLILNHQRLRPLDEQEEDLESILASDAASLQHMSSVSSTGDSIVIGNAETPAEDDDSQLIG